MTRTEPGTGIRATLPVAGGNGARPSNGARRAAAHMTSTGGTWARQSVDGVTALPPAAAGAIRTFRRLARATRNDASIRRDTVRRRSLAVADVLALAASFVCVELIRPLHAPLQTDLGLLAALPVWVLVNKLLGLYDRDPALIHKSTLDELPRLFESVVLSSTLLYFFGPLVPHLVGRGQMIVFALALAVLMPSFRGIARTLVVRRTSRERCVIVGSGPVAQTLAQKIDNHPEYGVELVCVMDQEWSHSADGLGADRRDVTEFERVCRQLAVERVVIAFSALSHDDLLELISVSKRLGLKVSVLPRLFEAIGHAVEIDQVEGMLLLGMRAVMRTSSSLMLKRAIDVMGAGLGLLLLTPLLMVIAIAIKLTSRGPVLFAQWRTGRNEKPFRMLKFRTMVIDAEELKRRVSHLNEATAPMFKISDDPRVTRVGRQLRRFSLDELPQLWNVLRGEMSLVGPRPLIPDEDTHVLGRHRARLDITPGLTGPWQVMGRTAIPFTEMVKLDYLYVAEWSLWSDLKLLIRTAPVVFGGRGR
ncbi:MAG TPA: sugar transferase [Solirubrobacteraceae bacterium]|nr:sugar transferase [Solirubrobacteraceae bacterium]